MARPRKGEEKDRPKHIGFRAATWVWEGVQKLAADKGMSASEVAHDLMEIGLGRLGIKPEPEPEPTNAAKAEGRSKKPKRSRTRAGGPEQGAP